MQANQEVAANTVLFVVQKGYSLNERVIRAAKVVVSKA
jgi:molecular chaperone GrpE (heat shock protein)